MDSIYYVGIALLIAVLLFVFLRGKKAPEAGSPGAPPTDKHVAPRADVARAEPADDGAPPEPASTAEAGAPTVGRHRKRPTDVEALRKGLARSRGDEGLFGRLKALFAGETKLDETLVERIEEVLLGADVGTATTQVILARLREGLSAGELKDESAVWDRLRVVTTEILSVDGAAEGLRLTAKPTVVLMVGVNGAGKTTTIGKLATQLQASGKVCVLAAGDTFRAAAVQQLVVWGQRIGCEVVRGKDGADPGSVLFDAVKRAKELGADVVLADTAGRLHTKTNLMSEMQKVTRTLAKSMDGAPHETLLVIDATTGQNALAQAKEFQESVGLTGIVLTKLDGTAKGGFILSISDSLKLPVRYVGVGERPNDLHEFEAEAFVEALLGNDT